MKKTIPIIFIFCIIILSGYGISKYFTNDKKTEIKNSEPANTQIIPSGEPTFEWTYSSFEEKEISRTTIGLIARYPNSAIQTKVIDTIQGGCNEYGEPDKDVYTKSTMIICYYAGLGHYYKIVESEGKYLVKRKIFEEAGPDYNPPKPQFETIATF